MHTFTKLHDTYISDSFFAEEFKSRFGYYFRFSRGVVKLINLFLLDNSCQSYEEIRPFIERTGNAIFLLIMQ